MDHELVPVDVNTLGNNLEALALTILRLSGHDVRVADVHDRFGEAIREVLAYRLHLRTLEPPVQ